MITVVTATYGDDIVQSQCEQDIDVRWVCVTDHLNPVDGTHHWEFRYEPRPHLTPRMAAHVVKCLPFHYASGDVIVWLDASARLMRSDSLRVLMSDLIYDERAHVDVMTLRHPDRSTVAAEAIAASKQARYAGQRLCEQVQHYRTTLYPDKTLYATTIIGYATTAQAHWLGERWLAEQARWTCQDQISLPYVAWQTGTHVVTSEEDLWQTPHIALRPRTREV